MDTPQPSRATPSSHPSREPAHAGEHLPSVFVIGSSTTLLMHPYLEKLLAGRIAYARKGQEGEQMAAALRDLDVPTGASAGDSSKVLAYLRTLEQDGGFAPDAVLLHVGFHDIRTDPQIGRMQVEPERSRDNVRAIVDWFGRQDLRLIWMRPGPLDERLHNTRCESFHRYEADLHAFNEAADEIMARHGVEVLDLAGFTERLGPMAELLKDHVHFTDPVVQKQARFVADYLERALLRTG